MQTILVELTQFEAEMAHLVLGLNDQVLEPAGSAVQSVLRKLEAAGVFADAV